MPIRQGGHIGEPRFHLAKASAPCARSSVKARVASPAIVTMRLLINGFPPTSHALAATEGGSGPGAVDDRHRERRSPSSSPKQSCAITGPSPPRQPICGRRSVQSPAVPDKLLLRTLPAEGLALCKLSDVRVGWQAIKTAALVTMLVGHLPQGSMHLNILTPEFI